MENYSYQRMRKFVEKTIDRKLTDREYKRFKTEYSKFVIEKFLSYPKELRDELSKLNLEWWRTSKRGKKLRS